MITNIWNKNSINVNVDESRGQEGLHLQWSVTPRPVASRPQTTEPTKQQQQSRRVLQAVQGKPEQAELFDHASLAHPAQSRQEKCLRHSQYASQQQNSSEQIW